MQYNNDSGFSLVELSAGLSLFSLVMYSITQLFMAQNESLISQQTSWGIESTHDTSTSMLLNDIRKASTNFILSGNNIDGYYSQVSIQSDTASDSSLSTYETICEAAPIPINYQAACSKEDSCVCVKLMNCPENTIPRVKIIEGTSTKYIPAEIKGKVPGAASCFTMDSSGRLGHYTDYITVKWAKTKGDETAEIEKVGVKTKFKLYPKVKIKSYELQ